MFAASAVPAPIEPSTVEDRHEIGAMCVARTLVEIGVETIFCYPGGANLELLDALSATGLKLVRTEHEQGAVFAAQGYARTSGRVGVCIMTSGPGATNAVTGIADAASDSVPILCLTGNVSTHWLGRNAFQEVDIVAVTRPLTKLSVQVSRADDIAPIIVEAARLATSGRPGPVLVDVPKDIQQAYTTIASTPDQARRFDITAEPLPGHPNLDGVYREIERLIAVSRNPVIYAGGGVIAAGVAPALVELAETLRCPVALTIMGLGAIDSAHPLFLGPLGMHGAWCANVAVNEADLVLALGVRFDDRVIGDPQAFARNATIVHVDIDALEFNKNRRADVVLHADLRDALPELVTIARPMQTDPWLRYLAEAREQHPLVAPRGDASLTGASALVRLSHALPPGSVVTTGVGQHQMWAMHHVSPHGPRSFLSSSGFGTMGFGLPAAIGAKCARPGSTVIDVDGDGSLNMTINELATCRRNRLGVKVFVVNNQWLGMVRQWQDMIYGGRRVTSAMGDTGEARGPDDGKESASTPYPDFVAIASGYGIRAERVVSPGQLENALPRFLADPEEPYLLDVVVSQESNVFPMIPAGKSYEDTAFDESHWNARDT